MPRIRSLKPEHKQHRKIGPLDHRPYRLWIGMLTEADDEGRLVADAAQLRMLIFGYHPKVKLAHVEADLLTLHTFGSIELYEVHGVRYARFPSWKDHQVINKPQPSKLPPPLHSLSGNGTLPEQSGNTPVGSRSDLIKDLIGRSIVGQTPDVRPLNGYRHDAETILSFLNAKAGRTFRATPSNLTLIEARLKAGASLEDCRGVIVRKVRAWAADPKMALYLRPATLFNATKFDQYVGEQGRPS